MNTRKFLNDSAARSPTDVKSADVLNPHEQAVLEAIRGTPFGTVEVVLHQSRIVQVVKTEKVKLDSGSPER
jgi:hypothetical protein